MKIILPFKGEYPLTQKFGVKFLYQGETATHKGVDYALPNITKVIAPFDGKVRRTTPGRSYGYGKAVYLEAKDKSKGRVEALMAHLDTITVEEGWNIKQGQQVGFSGRSGFWRGVNGYHIHFGISINNIYVDPFELLNIKDPSQSNLFNQDDSKLKSFLGSYTVQPGDNLWKISEKYYKNGGHFIEIYNVNQDILKNPNLIHPGDVLRIPALKNLGI